MQQLNAFEFILKNYCSISLLLAIAFTGFITEILLVVALDFDPEAGKEGEK